MLRSRNFRISILIVIALAAVNPTLAAAPIASENPLPPWADQVTDWVGELTSRVSRFIDSASWQNPFSEPYDDTTSQFLIETNDGPDGNEGEVLPGIDPLG